MHRIRGPGVAATHWLKATPPALITDDTVACLREADYEWADTWITVAGSSPDDLTPLQRARVHARVFAVCARGQHEFTLGHESAADAALLAPKVGVALAVDDVVRTAIQHGVHPASWGELLQLRSLTQLGSRDITDITDADIVAVVAEAATAAKDAREDRIKSLEQSAANTDSFYVWALSDPQELGHLTKAPKGVLQYAAARHLGLPVWPLLGIDAPADCALCGALYTPSVGLASEPTSVPLRDSPHAPGQRPYLDPFGDHISVCERLPRCVAFDQRHDAVVRFAAQAAAAAGISASVSDERMDGNQRPADWFEAARTQSRLLGLCCDFTLCTGGPPKLAEAVERKVRKYARFVASNEGVFELEIVGAATSGHVSHGTFACLLRWAKALNTRRALEQEPKAGKHIARAAFGRAVAGQLWRQALAYKIAALAHRGRRDLLPRCNRPFRRSASAGWEPASNVALSPDVSSSVIDQIISLGGPDPGSPQPSPPTHASGLGNQSLGINSDPYRRANAPPTSLLVQSSLKPSGNTFTGPRTTTLQSPCPRGVSAARSSLASAEINQTPRPSSRSGET
jgi:hypothetical protein